MSVSNGYFFCYLLYFMNVFCLYLFYVFSFPIQIKKTKACFIGFFAANFDPIISMVSLYLYGQNIIKETSSMLLLNKVLFLTGEVILILYLKNVLNLVWYNLYWITLLLMLLFSLTMQLMYVGHNIMYQNGAIVVHALTLNNLFSYLLTIAALIIELTIAVAITRFCYKKMKDKKIHKSILILVNSGILAIYLFIPKNYNNQNRETNKNYNGIDDLLLVIAFIIIIIALLLSLSFYIRQRMLIFENSLLKKQNELHLYNYMAQQKQEMNLYKLYHDIGNHMKTIQLLVIQGATQEAKQYAENLYLEYSEIRKDIYTSNKIINAVLLAKVKQCREYDIQCSIDINVPEVLSIKDIDLMSIFSNLLDNAIEGCLRNEGAAKYIRISSAVIQNNLVVKVINSKSPKENIQKNHFQWISIKTDKVLHGHGLRIINDIIHQYDGNKEFIDQGTEFHACVMLPLFKGF